VNLRAARIARPAVFTLVLGVCLMARVGCGGGVSDAGEWIRGWVRWPAGEGDGALRAPKPPAETVRLQSTDGVKLEGGAVGDGDAWVLILHEYPTSTLVGLDGYRFAKFSGPPRTHASRPRRRSRWL
jgi:hypothetical protein